MNFIINIISNFIFYRIAKTNKINNKYIKIYKIIANNKEKL